MRGREQEGGRRRTARVREGRGEQEKEIKMML